MNECKTTSGGLDVFENYECEGQLSFEDVYEKGVLYETNNTDSGDVRGDSLICQTRTGELPGRQNRNVLRSTDA